jgi:hypothetical protein
MLKLRQIRDPDYPALAPGAVKFIDAELTRRASPVVGEWGCGRSTLWFAKRCATLVSVEHDRNWRDVIASALQQRGAKHASIVLAEMASPTYPDAIFSTGLDAFDLLLIDGRLRHECADVATKAIKRGGIVVLDNSNRPEYSEFIPILGAKIGTFVGNCTETTIFRYE